MRKKLTTVKDAKCIGDSFDLDEKSVDRMYDVGIAADKEARTINGTIADFITEVWNSDLSDKEAAVLLFGSGELSGIKKGKKRIMKGLVKAVVLGAVGLACIKDDIEKFSKRKNGKKSKSRK